MTNRFPHIPDFAWVSHALPLKVVLHGYHNFITIFFGVKVKTVKATDTPLISNFAL